MNRNCGPSPSGRGRGEAAGEGLKIRIDLRPSPGARQRLLGLRPIGLALRAAVARRRLPAGELSKQQFQRELDLARTSRASPGKRPCCRKRIFRRSRSGASGEDLAGGIV